MTSMRSIKRAKERIRSNFATRQKVLSPFLRVGTFRRCPQDPRGAAYTERHIMSARPAYVTFSRQNCIKLPVAAVVVVVIRSRHPFRMVSVEPRSASRLFNFHANVRRV